MKQVIRVLAIPLLAAILSACTAAGTWELITLALQPGGEELYGPWKGVLEITVDTSVLDEYLFDVPVPIRIDSSRVRYELADPDGSDIGFYLEQWPAAESGGGSHAEDEAPASLDHEVSVWNPDGESVLWVRIPLVTPGDPVTIYMYMGSESHGVEPQPDQVWRNGYVGVYHFDDPEDPYRDSTVFANHGAVNVNGHTAPAFAQGMAGGALSLTDATDALVIPDDASIETMSPSEFAVWLNLPDVPGTLSTARVFSKGTRFLSVKEGSGQYDFQSRIEHGPAPPPNGPNDIFRAWTTSTRFDEWFLVDLAWTGSPAASSLNLRFNRSLRTRYNESPSGDNAEAYVRSDSGIDLVVGNGDWNGATLGFGNATGGAGGRVDELRISRIPRSAEWKNFQYDLITGATLAYGTFRTIWAEEYLK